MKYVISCILCFLVLSHSVRAELKFGGGYLPDWRSRRAH